MNKNVRDLLDIRTSVPTSLEKYLGEFTIETSPAIYSIDCVEGNEFSSDVEISELVSVWLKSVPFVYTGGYFLKEEIIIGSGIIKMFFVLMRRTWMF
ncbi:MAG: hypothetical protein PHP29_05050 [Tissierellia bacterium]|nr:hypothetical protein [Tissierellia bacterium]MDD4089042.1 hypothetical protein [Tissierellia bacterium]